MTEQPEYPVYEKDGLAQIAPNAEAEIRLRFNGWRQKSAVPIDPPPADPPTPPRERPKQRSKPTDE